MTAPRCRRRFKELTPQEQRVLYLRFFEGLTQTEIARQLEISQMQVSRLLRRTFKDPAREHRQGVGRPRVTEGTLSAERWRFRALRAWAVIGIAIIVAATLWLLVWISPILTPFVFAALVVFLLRRPVNRLEASGVPRGAAVGICYLFAAGVLLFVGLFVVPPLAAQTREFLLDFPQYFSAARDLWFQLQTEYTNLEIPLWLQDAAAASRESSDAPDRGLDATSLPASSMSAVN
jgi:hypothetical protein